MKIAIKHQTKYYFNEKLPKLVQSLKLFPSICSNQKVIDWRINSNEGAIINSYQDSLGHKIYNLYIENIVGEQIICSSGIIDTKDLNGVISGLIEKVHPFCFLRETNLTKTSKNIIVKENLGTSTIHALITFSVLKNTKKNHVESADSKCHAACG